MASMLERIERLQLIESLMPKQGDGADRGLTIVELEQRLANQPGFKVPHRRTLQRDLLEMTEEGRVAVLSNSEGGPRYQAISEPFEFDPALWGFFLEHLKQDLEGLVSASDLVNMMRSLQRPSQEYEYTLDERKLRILPDSLRLRPAEIRPQPFGCVLRALASGCALRAVYYDRLCQRSEPVLHPLALLQRGPRVYLYAMKNDETTDRMYALDRFFSAECLPDAARTLPDFDLDQRIANGRADFANGEMITLKVLVRGYIRQLVEDCPLVEGQLLEALDEDRDAALLTVEIPSSGQLLRWVLAGGENITVLEPIEFRDVVAEQIRRVSARYQINSEFERSSYST